jgi:hypothetical protein
MVKPTGYTESGQPIYKYDDQERECTPPHYGEEGWSEKIAEHVEQFYGPVESVFHEVISDLIHVDVYWIKPTPEQNFHTLFTTGMSFLPMNTPKELPERRYAELMAFLPPDWLISEEAFQDPDNYWPVYWLKMLARFPHQYDSWLADAHTMPNGDPPEPLSGKTNQDGIILLPPIMVSADFHGLRMDEERVVNFYAIVPLYPEEMAFKLKHGVEALLDRFDKHGINELIDLNRTNVCKKPLWKFW